MGFWDIPRHIAKINDELGEIFDRLLKLEGQMQRVAKLEADMVWVKWMTLAILGGVIALLIKVYIAPAI